MGTLNPTLRGWGWLSAAGRPILVLYSNVQGVHLTALLATTGLSRNHPVEIHSTGEQTKTMWCRAAACRQAVATITCAAWRPGGERRPYIRLETAFANSSCSIKLFLLVTGKSRFCDRGCIVTAELACNNPVLAANCSETQAVSEKRAPPSDHSYEFPWFEFSF